MKISNNYNGIDMMKFLMAILVVFIHISPFIDVDVDINFFTSIVITRIAVPYFFIASGFFLGLKIKKVKEQYEIYHILKKQTYRLLMLYCIWSLIYFPYSIYINIETNKPIIRYLQECIFEGSHVHLWFLPSLIIAQIIATFLYKNVGIRRSLIIAFILYLMGLLDSSYYGIVKNSLLLKIIEEYNNIFLTTRNGIFFGLIFVLLGFFAIDNFVTRKQTVIWGSLSFIGLIAEVYVIKYIGIAKGYDMILCAIPVTYFLFKYAQNLEMKGSGVYYHMRRCSTYMFFTHLWIAFLIRTIGRKGFDVELNSLINCILTIIFVIITYYLISRIKNKKIKNFVEMCL